MRDEIKDRDRERAEEILKAPVEFQIDRPISPPIPAIKTKKIMNNNNNNTNTLDDKWAVRYFNSYYIILFFIPFNTKDLVRGRAVRRYGLIDEREIVKTQYKTLTVAYCYFFI